MRSHLAPACATEMKLSHATANGFAGAWLDAARRAWLTRAAKGNTSRNSAGVLAVTTTEDVYVRHMVEFAQSLHSHNPTVRLHVVSTNAILIRSAFGRAFRRPGTYIPPWWSVTTFHDRTKDDDIKSLLARVPDRPLRAALETRLRYKLMKLHHVARSPFERTLYVDTDAKFCGDIRPLFSQIGWNRASVHFAAAPVFGAPRLYGVGSNGAILQRQSTFVEVNGGVLLYDRYGSAVLARWERAYLKRLEQAVATGAIVMKERDLPSWKDQPSFWMVLNESLKSGLAFGLLDTRWDMRHALCTFENGTLHRISDRPPTGCRMARPFILHEAHSSDRDRVSRHTATGVRLMSCAATLSPR